MDAPGEPEHDGCLGGRAVWTGGRGTANATFLRPGFLTAVALRLDRRAHVSAERDLVE